MSNTTPSETAYSVPVNAEVSCADLALPSLEMPSTQEDLTPFLSCIINGNFTTLRTRLATANHPDYERLLANERILLRSNTGSVPENAPLTEQQRRAVKEVFAALRLTTPTDPSVSQRIGSWIRKMHGGAKDSIG